jgi:hypothetical protein
MALVSLFFFHFFPSLFTFSVEEAASLKMSDPNQS